MNGPRWIKQWIADLALLNEQFRNDDGSVNFEELGREEYMFRTALITQKLDKSDRARDIYMKAKAAYDASSENGKKGGRPRKQETTADGDTREDSHDEKSGTSANNSEARQSQRTGGGSARRTGCSIVPPVRSYRFRNKEEYINWAADSGLDLVDAGECWDATVERGWKDADGKPVNNIKAFASQWCATREEKRNKRKTA